MRSRPTLGTLLFRGVLAAALAGAASLAPARAAMSVLHHFTNAYADAPNPVGQLAVGPSNYLYGFTQAGGAGNGGTFFKMSTAGLVTPLRDFGTQTFDPSTPCSGPLYISSAGGFFATSLYGGQYGYGAIYKLTTGGTVSVMHSFAANADGAYPYAGLVQAADSMLYGVTSAGGAANQGTVFRIKTDGTGYTILHHFDYATDTAAFPMMGLAEGDDGYLYGTASYADGYYGGIYRIKKDGTGYQFVHGFSNALANGSPEGFYPHSDLVKHTGDHHIYGTTTSGGAYGLGVVFRLNTTTQEITPVWAFDGLTGANPAQGTNNQSRLLQGNDGKLYGVTVYGGYYGLGTSFKMDVATSAVTLLGSFNVGDGNASANPLAQVGTAFYNTSFYGGATSALGGPYGTPYGYGSATSTSAVGAVKNLHSFHIQDASQPYGGLVAYSTTSPIVFYGTTPYGGIYEQGAIYKIDSTGKFSIIHSMNNALGEGTTPFAGLVKGVDGALYGTTTAGGAYGSGTVFKVTTSGALTTIHHFRGNLEGYNPYGRLVQGVGTDKNLYGVCAYGGPTGYGTVFSTDTAGKAFKVIHYFGGWDGTVPMGSLTPDLGNGASTQWLYGTTSAGGANGQGVIFKMNTTGTVYGKLFDFDGTHGASPSYAGSLLLYSNQLFGVAYYGGANGYGTLFRTDPNTGATTVVHDFASDATDGYYPVGGVVADNSGNLYGVTQYGGPDGWGVVYKVYAPTGAFTPLTSFGGLALNGEPSVAHDGVVLAADGKLYGTTYGGGSANYGALYSQTTSP